MKRTDADTKFTSWLQEQGRERFRRAGQIKRRNGQKLEVKYFSFVFHPWATWLVIIAHTHTQSASRVLPQFAAKTHWWFLYHRSDLKGHSWSTITSMWWKVHQRSQIFIYPQRPPANSLSTVHQLHMYPIILPPSSSRLWFKKELGKSKYTRLKSIVQLREILLVYRIILFVEQVRTRPMGATVKRKQRGWW